MRTEISIILPVYNKCKYLNKLFEDISQQTFSNYECVVIDDGSTDGSEKVCDYYAELDSRIKVYHIKNGGVSNARNYGLLHAKGEYVTFLDADDRLYPQYLNNLYQRITDNDVDLVISGIEKYWIDSERKEYIKAPFVGIKDKYDIMTLFARVQKDTGIFGFCVAKILKKELLTDIKFDSKILLAEDFDFYLKVYRKVQSIYFDDKCYYRYLQCAENSSVLISDDKIDYLSQLVIHLRYKQFLIDEGVYLDENKIIIDEKINNYIYYVIFYSSKEDIHSKFIKLKEIIDEDDFKLKGNSFLQKWILLLFKMNQYEIAKYTLFFYRNIRGIIRKMHSSISCNHKREE